MSIKIYCRFCHKRLPTRADAFTVGEKWRVGKKVYGMFMYTCPKCVNKAVAKLKKRFTESSELIISGPKELPYSWD